MSDNKLDNANGKGLSLCSERTQKSLMVLFLVIFMTEYRIFLWIWWKKVSYNCFSTSEKFKHAYSPVFRIDNFFEVIPKSIWCYPTFYSNIRRNFPFAWRSSLHKVESRHLDFFFRETDAPLPHGRASRCWLRFFWLLLDWRWCSCESGFETWRLTGCFGRRRSRLATSRHFCRLGCFRRL